MTENLDESKFEVNVEELERIIVPGNAFLRAVICGTLLIALISEVGMAQATTTLWENLQQVKAGQNVSVVRRNSSVTKGKFHHSSQDGISLEIEKQLTEIRRDDVLKVELRKGRARHIAIGAAIGAALGIAVNARGSTEGSWTAIFIPIGAGGGAGVGAVFPASHSVVYEHPCVSQGNCGGRPLPRNNVHSKRPFQGDTPAAAPDERRHMNTAERRLSGRSVDGLAVPD